MGFTSMDFQQHAVDGLQLHFYMMENFEVMFKSATYHRLVVY
jgi:hypothetical protein